MNQPIPTALILAGVAALIVASLVALLAKRYRRCPSNMLLIIYGNTGSGAAKCVHGGAAFVWPLFQASEYLPLDPFVVPIDLSNALSHENIRVSVPTTMTVAVSTREGIMENAAVRLLGSPKQEIRSKAEDIILGQMRAVIATMRIDEINRDRQAFLGKVNDAVAGELEKIGLEVINTNIKDIDDESGYIKALGRKAAAEAIQQAEIDVSEAKRHGEIGVAEREKDRRIAVSKAVAAAQVGEAQAERDRRIAMAQAQSEGDVGEANAARERRIAMADADATAQVGEGESARTRRQKLAVLEAEAVQTEAQASAEQARFRGDQSVAEEEARTRAEGAARRADGTIRVAAETAAKEAEDARASREQSRLHAEVIVPAEAEKRRVALDAEAEQLRLTLIAEGNARAELARAEAEAKGTQAILDAKAEGYRGLVSAVGNQLSGLLIVEKLADLSRIQADAVKNLPIEKITVWDSGGEGAGLSRLGKQLIGVLPPLHDLAKQAGLDLPESLGKLDTSDSGNGESSRA